MALGVALGFMASCISALIVLIYAPLRYVVVCAAITVTLIGPATEKPDICTAIAIGMIIGLCFRPLLERLDSWLG